MSDNDERDARATPWATVQTSEQRIVDTIKQSIMLFGVLDYDSDSLVPLGTGFVLAVNGETALCVTAAHVLVEAARRCSASNSFRSSRAPFDVDDPPELYERARKSGRLTCLVFDEKDQARPSRVEGFWWMKETDLCLIAVKLTKPAQVSRRLGFGLNSDVLQRGVKVISIAPIEHTCHLVDSSAGTRTYEINAPLQLRIGSILDVHPRDRLLKCGVYETSIPFSAGMSGGPVLLAPTSSAEPMVVVGVISKDISVPEAHTDATVAGSSTVVPILFAYLLEIEAAEHGRVDFKKLLAQVGARDFGREAASICIETDELTGDRRFRNAR